MPLEVGVWRIDEGLQAVDFGALDLESRLEDFLDQDISIADPNWMVVGRQVRTSYEKFIDLLALDRDGNLVVIELKRDKTYRDIVAQVLDYGSWVKELRSDDIAQIFETYLKKYRPADADMSIDDAFCKRFSVAEMPDELNGSHQLVIVASALDPSTERVVQYLSELNVQINAVFFRVFKEEGREYLLRAWLNEPTIEGPASVEDVVHGKWNGEYYVSFGGGRDWEDARKYGFISGGGGSWYTRPLWALEPGARIWVNIPERGYVGVGTVTAPVVPIDDFRVVGGDGAEHLLLQEPLKTNNFTTFLSDPDQAEYVVGVKWVKTLPVTEAIREKGFFGNQNTVARPTSPKWDHTVERLKKRLGVS